MGVMLAPDRKKYSSSTMVPDATLAMVNILHMQHTGEKLSVPQRKSISCEASIS
jgi:hypothetical protein